MAQVAETTGNWPQEYRPIEPPEHTGFVWEVFWELRRSVKAGFGGGECIGFMEIDAWQRVRDFRLGNFIVDMLLAMDRAYLAEVNKPDRKN